MKAEITIHTDQEQGVIAPEVYGHFIEHLGHCIYDGIWVGRDSKIPNIDGIREETVNVLRAVKAPLLRWPGGYFADLYDWRDGIGPSDKRPLRFHQCEPNCEESNQFGTHEFLRLCELVGAEPNICVNTATLGPQEAMDWVEYCNHDGRTSQAVLRCANGRQEPWGVKYWAVGNEAYLLFRPKEYVQRYLLWRKFMRRVAPEGQYIASFSEPTRYKAPFSTHEDAFIEVLQGIGDHMELASLHLYTAAGDGEKFTEAEYWAILSKIDQRNRLRIESFLGAIDAVTGHQRVKLALDEWGVWHPGASMTNNCEQPCTHRDAMFAARYFHLLQRYPRRIGIATIAQSVNVLQSLLCAHGPETYRTPTFHIFEMFRNHQGGRVLPLAMSNPRIDIEEKSGSRDFLVRQEMELDVVTTSASLDADGRELLLTLTNADLESSCTCDVQIKGGWKTSFASARVLTADPRAQNSVEEPDRVKPKELVIQSQDNNLHFELPACSIAAVTLSS